MNCKQFKNLIKSIEYKLNLFVMDMIECYSLKPDEVSLEDYYDTLEPVFLENNLKITDDLFYKAMEYYFNDDKIMLDYLKAEW